MAEKTEVYAEVRGLQFPGTVVSLGMVVSFSNGSDHWPTSHWPGKQFRLFSGPMEEGPNVKSLLPVSISVELWLVPAFLSSLGKAMGTGLTYLVWPGAMVVQFACR